MVGAPEENKTKQLYSMKTKTPHVLTLGAALLLAPLTSTFAQSTWQTVDDFQLAPGHGAAIAGIAAADAGVVFSACMGSDAAGLPHGFIRRSLDGGQTWLNVLDLPGTSSANCWSATVAPSGLVFATGTINATNWVTARSSDGGTTWSIVDSWVATGRYAFPYSVVGDAAGRVFVGGDVWDAQGKQHFLTRRSLDGGTTWTTVDDFAGTISGVWGMTATPAGVFAAGRLSDVWIVRRSTDGGNTWATVDKYAANNLSYAYGMSADASGNLYVTGAAVITVNKVTKSHWITRKSANGGATWGTADDVASGSFNGGWAVTVDAYGRVFAAGMIANGNTSLWVTRASTDGGMTWLTTDDYALSASGPALARGAASDAVGNVFIGGQANGTDGAAHAIVRKLAAP
jgi:hypothetical protein